jgi:signal peptidase
MSARWTRLLHAGRQAALTTGAVVGVACLLLTVLALLLDARPLVFRSDSMSPTIGTGSLAVARRVDADSLRVGQVVSVPTASGERVTHRIKAVQHEGPRAVLVLQGDANRAPDPEPYVVDHADRVLFSVPWVGYAVGWLTRPVGLLLLGLYAAVLLSVVLRPPGPTRGPCRGRA